MLDKMNIFNKRMFWSFLKEKWINSNVLTSLASSLPMDDTVATIADGSSSLIAAGLSTLKKSLAVPGALAEEDGSVMGRMDGSRRGK